MTDSEAARPTLRLALPVACSAVLAVLALAGSAFAAGAPVNVGTPYEIDGLSSAVDNAGDAVLAWSNTKDLPPATTNVVQYCVLPVGATGCSHSGTLVPADGATNIDGVQVLNEGSTLVVLADVYGAKGAQSSDYEPEQEWQSTDDGATFAIINGGLSVADGIINADTAPLSAVTVPGTGVLGYGWDTAGGPPTFNAFPLTGPPECSEAVKGCAAGFATLEPNTNPDQISNAGGQFADAPGGVLGVFFTDFTNGPLGCSGAQTVPFGTAYAYASGAQSATNNYNISPGSPDSAWRVAATQADCNVEYFAVDGGPSGFGVLEDNELTGQTVYHRFDQSTDSFDTPLATVVQEGEQDPAVSQDGGGGVYATFLGAGGRGGPIRLAYSYDGGNTWTTNTLNPNSDGGAEEVTSSVNEMGQGWVTWIDNGSVYAQSFLAADAIAPVSVAPAAPDAVTTTQTSGAESGANITVPAGTVGETDRATITGVNGGGATGSVTYALYSKSDCEAASRIFNGGTAPVAGGVAASSTPVTTGLAPGKYYWLATYSGNTGNLANASSCGSEVLTVVPAAEIGSGGTSNGTTITITVTCVSTPCTVTLTITVTESGGVMASAGRFTVDQAKKKKPRTKTITLATGKFTIHHSGPSKLIVRLTKAGRKLLADHHGDAHAKVLLSELTAGGLEKTTRTITITTHKAKKNKK